LAALRLREFLAEGADSLYDEVVPRTFDQILAEARELPTDQQERLVDELAATLHEASELSPEWKREIARRIGQIERGEVELLDGDQVLRELRERFPG
jgi:hypothetical protein